MVDEQIIRALRGEHLEEGVLDRILEFLRAGSPPEELAREAVGATPSYEDVVRTMCALEGIATQDMALTLKLMIGLYPVASEIFAYDVCDSIELWLEHEGTHEVRDFIASVLSANPSFGAREKLMSWLQLLDKR